MLVEMTSPMAVRFSKSRIMLLTVFIHFKRIMPAVCMYMCTIAPCRDVNVLEFNEMLPGVQSEFSNGLIDCYNAFVLGNGRSARHLFTNDGIHPNFYGSSTLVSSINEIVQISKQQRKDPDNSWQRPSYNRYQHGPHLRKQNLSCTNCDRTNHATRECSV